MEGTISAAALHAEPVQRAPYEASALKKTTALLATSRCRFWMVCEIKKREMMMSS